MKNGQFKNKSTFASDIEFSVNFNTYTLNKISFVFKTMT